MQCLCCWGNEKYEKWWIWSLWFNDDLMMIYWDIQICIYIIIYIDREWEIMLGTMVYKTINHNITNRVDL
jgi:hypothetical protein